MKRQAITFVARLERNLIANCYGTLGVDSGHVIHSIQTRLGSDGVQAFAFAKMSGLDAFFFDFGEGKIALPPPADILRGEKSPATGISAGIFDNITFVDEIGERVWFKVPPHDALMAANNISLDTEYIYFDCYKEYMPSVAVFMRNIYMPHKIWINLGDPKHHQTDLAALLDDEAVRSATWVQLSTQDSAMSDRVRALSKNRTARFVLTEGAQGAHLIHDGEIALSIKPPAIARASSAFAGAYFAALAIEQLILGHTEDAAIRSATNQTFHVISEGPFDYLNRLHARD